MHVADHITACCCYDKEAEYSCKKQRSHLLRISRKFISLRRSHCNAVNRLDIVIGADIIDPLVLEFYDPIIFFQTVRFVIRYQLFKRIVVLKLTIKKRQIRFIVVKNYIPVFLNEKSIARFPKI